MMAQAVRHGQTVEKKLPFLNFFYSLSVYCLLLCSMYVQYVVASSFIFLTKKEDNRLTSMLLFFLAVIMSQLRLQKTHKNRWAPELQLRHLLQISVGDMANCGMGDGLFCRGFF